MSIPAVILRSTAADIRRQVLRGTLLGLILVPTLLVWVAVGSSLFGYRAATAWGTSMEPAIRNGDALWMKQLDIAEVKIDDIVALTFFDDESITHRVVELEHLSQGSYIVVTKGDANAHSEDWEISADSKIELVTARVPFGGYVLKFLDSVFGKVLIILILFTLVVILMHRRRMAR